jgi:hypothetical protein
MTFELAFKRSNARYRVILDTGISITTADRG